ncbi:MAG: hypothetical protein PHY43_03890 [Verrucomicrobiales bacterium]|nr:hypothetical protein [Verrucomicrobiales bacterium]
MKNFLIFLVALAAVTVRAENPIPADTVTGGDQAVYMRQDANGKWRQFIAAPSGGTLPVTTSGGSTLPVTTVSAAGIINGLSTVTNAGFMFGPDTPGTLTCGIQEAINSLPKATNRYSPGGGTVQLSPGLFKTAATITVNSNIASTAFSLTLRGEGMSATGILITNNIPACVFSMDALGTTNGWIFNTHDMFYASVTNACTNLVSMNGPIQTGQPYRGNISRCDIQRCWFGWWEKMTNAAPSIYGLTPDVANSNGKQNLTAIYYNNNLGDFLTIEKNQFTFVGNIVLANDHLSLWQNSFEGCGTEPGSGVNDWPVTDPRRSGYVVIFQEPVGGITYNNGTTWHIGQNFFVSNAGSYLFNVGFTTPPKMIWSDQFETSGNIIATVCPITFGGWTHCVSPMLFYDITNTANFSYAFQSDTGLVTVAELTTGLDTYRFNATNRNNFFTGTFAGTFSAVNLTTTLSNGLALAATVMNNGGSYTNKTGGSVFVAVTPSGSGILSYTNFVNGSVFSSGFSASSSTIPLQTNEVWKLIYVNTGASFNYTVKPY